VVHQFDYDPSANQKAVVAAEPDKYASYSDDVILKQWRSVIPPEHVIRVEDPKAIVDVLLGALAIADGNRTLESFLKDLTTREASDKRLAQVRRSLASITSVRSTTTVEGDVPTGGGAPRAGRSRRL
jgi:hypothetical protein